MSTICRTLKFMGCTKQVIRHVAIQQDDAMRAKFMAEISMFLIHQCSFGWMKVVATNGTAEKIWLQC